MSQSGRKYVGMPGYGDQTSGAARGFWNATQDRENTIYRCSNGSLLANNFNRLWVNALNYERSGEEPVVYFAMQHADVEPIDYWLDVLIDELEREELDVLGVAMPIKDSRGLTSIALDNPPDTWRPACRLTVSEVARLPPTFTSEDVGRPLLLNTGLWVAKLGAWSPRCYFNINDRIYQEAETGLLRSEVEPEDWFFSRLLHEQGVKVGCTSRVRALHAGRWMWDNSAVGGSEYDREYLGGDGSLVPVDASFPYDVEGWLSQPEGKALEALATGRKVLEIGSYCGRSTICLGKSAEKVDCLDTWDGRGTGREQATREKFEQNIRHHLNGRHLLIEAVERKEASKRQYDLVFVDGGHDEENVRNDTRLAVKTLTPGGLIAYHDYREFPGQHDSGWNGPVTRMVDKLVDHGAKLLSRHDTLAVVKPPATLTEEVFA